MQSFIEATHEKAIDLNEIDLTTEQLPLVFDGLKDILGQIEILNLGKNKIKSLPIGILDKLTSLKELYLNNNTIETLDKHVFANNHNLEHLELEDNPLKDLDDDIFVPTPNLEYLDLETLGDSMTRLPLSFYATRASNSEKSYFINDALKERLNKRDAEIATEMNKSGFTVDFLNDTLSKGYYNGYLDLGMNTRDDEGGKRKIANDRESYASQIFYDIKKIKAKKTNALRLHYTGAGPALEILKKIDEKTREQITIFELRDKELKEDECPQIFLLLPNLTSLSLVHCYLNKIEISQPLEKLIELNLSRNSLGTFAGINGTNFPNLEVLNLSSSYYDDDTLGIDTIGSLKKLQELDLGRCKLEKEQIKPLVALLLDKNKLPNLKKIIVYNDGPFRSGGCFNVRPDLKIEKTDFRVQNYNE